jgi:hypothetical protein
LLSDTTGLRLIAYLPILQALGCSRYAVIDQARWFCLKNSQILLLPPLSDHK